jgi:hypothetical protein
VIKIHSIQTGSVKVREAQRMRRHQGAAALTDMLFDPEWTDWFLPSYYRLIPLEHSVHWFDWVRGQTRTEPLPQLTHSSRIRTERN